MQEEVLVAVDGSERSDRIVDYASDFAKRTSLPILLVYVVKKLEEEPEGVREFEKVEKFQDAYANYFQGIGDAVTTRLGERIAKQEVPYRVLIEFGNPAERILALSKSENSKFIVVGLRGLHGVALMRSLGSVARRVVENAECPVLVVP